MDPVAQRISAIIEEKGYSYAGFAEAIDVQRAKISHILSGRNRPSLDIVQRILRAFPDLDSEYLLFGQLPEKKGLEGKGSERSSKPSNKRVERVVICYEDGTFASYEADG